MNNSRMIKNIVTTLFLQVDDLFKWMVTKYSINEFFPPRNHNPFRSEGFFFFNSLSIDE